MARGDSLTRRALPSSSGHGRACRSRRPTGSARPSTSERTTQTRVMGLIRVSRAVRRSSTSLAICEDSATSINRTPFCGQPTTRRRSSRQLTAGCGKLLAIGTLPRCCCSKKEHPFRLAADQMRRVSATSTRTGGPPEHSESLDPGKNDRQSRYIESAPARQRVLVHPADRTCRYPRPQHVS